MSGSLLASSLRLQRRGVVLGSLLAVVHQVCEALVAVLIGVVVDEAVRPGRGDRLLLWLAVLAVVFVALASSAAVGYYRLTRAETAMAHDLRLRVTRRVVDARGGTEGVGGAGELVSVATSDAGRVGVVTHVVGGGVSAAAALAAGLAYLVATSWQLGAVVLVGLPLLVWLSQRFAVPLTARSTSEQAAVARAAGVAVDLVRGLRVLKGLGAEAAAAERYRAVSEQARVRRTAAARYVGLSDGAVLGLGGLLVVAVAWSGGRLALAGQITVGQLVAAVGLAAFLVGPLERLVALPADLAVVRASAARIEDVLGAAPAVADGTSPWPQGRAAALELRDVVSGSLCGLDLAVPPGRCVGVVAPDRRDAASLVDVLARRLDPDAGAVTLDGTPLSSLRLADLRSTVVVSDSDAVLFEGPLRDSVPGEHRAAALAASGADEVAASLPDGVEADVGERGRRLSGGQRQRVVLARALAADAPVLVLHDPTTAVDAATEHRIARGLRDLRSGRSTLLVTTSPALLAVCDEVVVLGGGRVAARGAHADLTGREDYRRAVLA